MDVMQGNGGDRPCPLCNIPDQEVLAEFPRWKLARTRTMKGHRERLMIYHNDHAKALDEQSVGEAHMLLMTVGQRYFSYAEQWAVFEPIYATVPDHWHRVASDLDPGAEDHEQILKTPRLIIDTHRITINIVNPEPQEKLSELSSSSQHGTSHLQLPSGFSRPAEVLSLNEMVSSNDVRQREA